MKPCARYNFVKNNLQNRAVAENVILKQFQINLDDEKNAFVEYIKTDTLDLVHSFIPEEYQGLGFGHILAQRIFDHLVGQNQKFKITCEFLYKIYEKNCEKYKAFVLN